MKVVCVKYSGIGVNGGSPLRCPIFVGETYTVAYEWQGDSYVLVERPDDHAYMKSCFQPLKEVLSEINIEELTSELAEA